jgi:hypothetical protein
MVKSWNQGVQVFVIISFLSANFKHEIHKFKSSYNYSPLHIKNNHKYAHHADHCLVEYTTNQLVYSL